MKKTSFALVLLAIAGLTISANAASNVSLSFVNSLTGTNNNTVFLGSEFTYNIVISNLHGSPNTANSPALSVYDLFVNYDSSQISYQRATLNDNYVNDDPYYSDDGSGQIELFNMSLFNSPEFLQANQAALFTIGTITFKALKAGFGTLIFDSSSRMLNEYRDELTFSTESATVTTNAVPEPSSAALIALGAGGLVLVVLRRRSQVGV